MATLVQTRSASPAGNRLPPIGPQGNAPSSPLGFLLFLLVNIALFVRPADIVHEFIGLEIYQYLIIACFVVSFPAVLARLDPSQIENRPVDVCLILLFPCIVLSHLSGFRLMESWDVGFAYAKLLIYYFLLVSLVNTGARLRQFLGCLVISITLMTIVSILNFFHFIELPKGQYVAFYRATIDPTRMYGPGIFHDPNDVCVIISTAMVLLFVLLSGTRSGLARLLWSFCFLILFAGFYFTGSRGGLLALLAGIGLLIRLKYGWRRAIFLGAMGFPVIVGFLGARQAGISLTAQTGQERMYLWNEGYVMLRANPIFGVGVENFPVFAGHVAHNSYIHAFAELGFLGGTFFLGAVTIAVLGLYRLATPVKVRGMGSISRKILDPEMKQLYPFVTAATLVYAIGMFTLSLNMVPTTYTFLGLASIYMVTAKTYPATPPIRFDFNLFVKLIGWSFLFLAGLFVFIKIATRF